MVNAQFGLRDNPFRLTPDLGVRCDWASFTATRGGIAEGLRSGRKLILTGESGVGKTLLLRSLGQELGPLGAAYVVGGRHFGLAELSRMLGASAPSILLLDDAHHLDPAMLADLVARDGALALGATSGFSAGGLDALTLAPLQPDEVSTYVHCRLAAAGWSGGELFDAAACERLWRFSQGAARRINNLSSAALFLASQRQSPRIDAELIEAAAAGLSLQPAPATPSVAPLRRRAAASGISPSAESPMIMAAFMRDRMAPPSRRPDDAPPVTPPSPERIAEQTAPAAAGTLLRDAEAARGEASTNRPLAAPAVQRWADDAEPPPSPRAFSRAMPIALALGAVFLVGLGLAWRLELAPKPALRIDWARVQAVTSPQVGPAAASEGPALAAAAPEAQSSDMSAPTPPIVFPNLSPEAASSAATDAASATPPPVPAPVAEPAASAAAEGPPVPAVEPTPAMDAPRAETPPQPAPAAEPAAEPATRVAVAPSTPPPPPPAVTSAAPEPRSGPSPADEARIADLLAQARRLALAFALTTPPGQSAYDSYRQVLAIDPRSREALAGLDAIAARYDDLAGLARQREKAALVQLYENRAAQVRRDRARFGADAVAPQSSAR